MKRFFTNIRNTYIVSFLVHLILFVILSFITLGTTTEISEYVTIDFGSPGSGMTGSTQVVSQFDKVIEEQEVVEKEKDEKIEKPLVKSEFDEILKKNEKKITEKEKIERTRKSENQTESISRNPAGDSPFGSGGYSFDWGGRGTRKILRWEKPKFPPGVQKEIDIKIKFTILPDGSVVSPIPLIKADTQLEDAAIQALKTWKFEPLRQNQIQFEQQVIITIPYRLE